MQSHNPKLKEVAHVARKKKRIPDFDHTYCPRLEHIYPTKLDTENGIRLNILYWYKTMVRCKHLVPRILQREFKFRSWLKVNKASNQIVHDQSATKFASMLQDIKKLQACKTAKILTAFLTLRKKKTITNIFNHVNRLTNNFHLNTVIEKKN